jgi:hypothetical protein
MKRKRALLPPIRPGYELRRGRLGYVSDTPGIIELDENGRDVAPHKSTQVRRMREERTKDTRERFVTVIPSKLHKRISMYCAHTRTTYVDFLIAAATMYLDSKET